jgi:hypothetical protein
MTTYKQQNITSQQWDQLDKISDPEIINLINKITQQKGLLLGNDWLQACQIIHQRRTQGWWSVKQRRWCLAVILQYHDELWE